MPNRLPSLPRRSSGKNRPRSRKRASFLFPLGERELQPHLRTCIEALEERLALAAPTVIDPTASAITPATALLGANMTNDGGNIVIQRGVVYSLTSVDSDPKIGDPGVTVASTPPEVPAGAFAVTVGPLTSNSEYSFRAFAINNNSPNETGYSAVATFSTSSGIVMPSSTVSPSSPTDYATLNKVMFFQPTPGMTLNRPDGTPYQVPSIPEKQLTLTNNLDHTVYPFMRDAAATIDPAAKDNNGVYQGEYDPIDQLNEEYRGYIGYQLNGVNYLGLLPGMTITVNVPLAFWDGARMEIATDGTYLINDAKVGASPAEPVPNPFQYYQYNTNGSQTARVALPAASASNGPAGVSGMVMWYRQGLNNQTNPKTKPIEQSKAPAGDAPSQLIEWTMRDPVLSTLNPNIDVLHKSYGETHANINYDVSYVDNMALPVAMEALDVPVPVQTVPPLDPRNPNPGPRLPYAWIGAAQSLNDFQAAIDNFTSNDKNLNGLGDYFGGQGWPQYYFPANRFPGGTQPDKIPSGQDAISDSPLFQHTTSYDAPISNHFMLTSGGTENFSLVGAGGAYSDGTTTLRIVANNPALQQILEEQLHEGMVVGIDKNQTGAPTVPLGTKVVSIGPANDPGFHFTRYEYTPGNFDTVLEVQLNNAIPKGTNPSYAFQFNRTTTDYATTAMVNLWYTWAKYYADHVVSSDRTGIAGQSLTTDNTAKTNQIQLTQSAATLGLVPGMLVTGSTNSGIFPLRLDNTGATTIESIDPNDPTIINLSQAVSTSQAGATYSFYKPSMTSAAIHGFDPATVLQSFAPTNLEDKGVPDVLKFAQNAYQLISLMSQIPSEDQYAPISAQIVHNVIGGNITKSALNGDANHKTEVAFRDKVKSLLRGVNDFTVQTDQQTQWYPDPSKPTGGQTFNVYNLDPFVWFVHKKMGLSGYGFSLDDDAADISGNFSTKLAVAIGGLNGLPNHVEWSNGAPYGPVSANAKVVSGNEIASLPPYSFFSMQPYNANEKIAGANISGEGVPADTYLYSFGSGGLYAYSYSLSDQPPPAQNPLPPAPTPGPLKIPPLAVNGSSLFTVQGPGTANGLPVTLPAGQTTSAGPYTNTLHGVSIPNGSTFTITSKLGNVTSYTQQYEQSARVSMVATPDSHDGKATPSFVPNAPLPELNTVVDGVLDAGRVEIVNGSLSGTGKVTGSLNVFGPVSGYADPIVLKPVNNEPIDPSWDNKSNTIRGTNGALLAAGKAAAGTTGSGTPGQLTVNGDVSMFGATFAVYAKGAAVQGSDYSWLSSDGKVQLGNSNLQLSLDGYTPIVGDQMTIVTAAKGVSGKFSQGNSITVNGYAFNIAYNPNSVVLTYAPTQHAELVTAVYKAVLDRPPDPAGLAHFVQALDTGTSYTEVASEVLYSTEQRGREVDALFATYLHRAADPAGRTHWISELSAGLSETDAALQFITSPEYNHLHPDDSSFVAALYNDVLGRAADASGLDHWVGAAQNGLSHGVIANTFLHSLEASQRTVTEFYSQYFGRAPDVAGLAFWSQMLETGAAAPDDVELAFLASDEFIARATDGKP